MLPDDFVQGAITYLENHPADHSESYRIVVPVRFATLPTTLAILDTGSPWCILSPAETQNLDIDRQDRMKLHIRGEWVPGWLNRLDISIAAEIGVGLTIQGTAFIPDHRPEEWRYPNFLGLDGFLDRLRFAVDPLDNLFYFGTL